METHKENANVGKRLVKGLQIFEAASPTYGKGAACPSISPLLTEKRIYISMTSPGMA